MGTALTLIGGGMYFHSQMVTFETKANMKMEEMSEHIDREILRRESHRPHRTRMTDELNVEGDGAETEEDS